MMLAIFMLIYFGISFYLPDRFRNLADINRNLLKYQSFLEQFSGWYFSNSQEI